MEKIVNFSNSQKATSPDLNKMGTYARESADHIAKDGITGGTRGFTGFNAVKTGQTKVTVAGGRLWNADGAIYANEDTGGTELDFLGVLPVVARRIAAIVVYGAPQPTQTESREFLTDATTRATEGRNTATNNWRTANVSYLLGDENATPKPPAIDPNYLVVAYATLTPTAVLEGSVVANEDTRLKSARDAHNRALAAAAAVATFEPKLVSIEHDVAGVKIDVNSKLDADFGYRMAFDLAQLKRASGIPDSYIDYHGDNFIDATFTSTTDLANGHAAKVQEGLRFPPANSGTFNGLALLNPNDATVYKDPSGLILPSWKDTRTRLVVGTAGDIALNSIAYDSTSILIANMSRARNRTGPEFIAGQSWFTGANLIDPVRLTYQKDGEIFQGYVDPNIFNPDGTVQVRLRKQWNDSVSSNYWTRDSANPTVVAGYKYAQTFLNARDQWLTAIGLGGFTYIDTAGGAMVLMLAECTSDGRPNDQKVLATTTVLPGQITGLNLYQKFPITPTLVEKGKYYCYIIASAANHHIGISDTLEPAVGSLFFKNGAGYWQSDASKNIKIDLWFAEFDRVRTEVQLQTLTLNGGIGSIDVLAQTVVPSSSTMIFEVQVAGNWIPLTPENVANHPFASNPDTLPFRVVFSGGVTVQPGINLQTMQLKLSRPAGTLKHFSTPLIIPTATTHVRTKTRVENFNPAKHTVTPKLKPSGGAELAASIVSDRLLGNNVLERTAFFTLPSAATVYQRVTLASTTDTSDLCVITDVGDVATAT